MTLFVLFDLDYTLWPFYTNLLTEIQFKDKLDTFEFSNDVLSIFKYIIDKKIQFGFISRSKYRNRCKLLLRKLNIDLDITPNVILWCPNKTKLPQLEKLIKDNNINLEVTQFILFDDDIENLESVKEYIYKGVLVNKKTCIVYDQFLNALDEVN